MSDDKVIRLNRAMQDVRDRTGKTLEQVEQEFTSNPATAALFEVMYEQVQSLREQAEAADRRADTAESRRDLAIVKGQGYYDRLRTAGLLKEGERY